MVIYNQERPRELSSLAASLDEVVNDGYEEILRRPGVAPEVLLVLLANAPTVTSELINQGVEILRSNPKLDAAITVTPHNEFHPRHALRVTPDGRLEPFPDDRVGTPDEIAHLICFLLSAGTGYITGQTNAVSGGE